jgi:hypothetical protein
MHSSFIAFIPALFVVNIAYATEVRTFDRTLQVTGTTDLDVSSGPGTVSITAGPAGVVRIHAVIRPLTGAADLGFAEAKIQELEQKPPIEQQGNRIRVGYVNHAAIFGRVSITYDIETPRESRCRVTTSSGGIRIDGIAGPATAQSSSGRLEIEAVTNEVSVKNSSGTVLIRRSGGSVSARTNSAAVQVLRANGPVDVETTSGRTELSDVAGDVNSRTNSGSIIVDRAAAAVTATNHSGSIDAQGVRGEVKARTRSGAIRISQSNAAPITARTENGAIRVDLAPQGGYDLDAQSDSGKVSGPATTGAERIAEARRLKGQVRGGGPLVDLDTRSSRIVVN